MQKKSDQHLKKLRSKRKDAGNNIPDLKNGILPQVGEDTIITTYEALGEYQSILGKDLCASIKNVANSKSLPNVASFGKTIPKNLSFEIAEDLKILLK